MRHWFLTAVTGIKEDGTFYTVCTQRFFIDEDRCMVDLADIFKNSGVGLKGVQVQAYVARNSTGMCDDKGRRLLMAPVDQAGQILLGALSAGYGKKPDIQDAMAYITHLNNVLKPRAIHAYLVEYAKAHPESPSDSESQGDDVT